ncbi:EscV/YscV/HrcV family type III secretion system export apparatus protein [Xanthomonas theicola]|uniref:EscV/YscV/HrcV family type III secretion system export apparatus protein n=1 Tax=Xanthomonas theicola TaxID=56464 RepID=A0A2S6ZDT7_9XANT|nr:EscV/YscV/HrcV family type III secretion system export apparatus protein [Xanthomonas theicola]PPT90444.1 EscV/YscV/HrcV family type III secretion system export apparatus protein [Xanthomonas theicola]QNH25250.1 EscV/YscV/HrcV family type III secretion system export apparatus protein [Xanthomonas theicola]
MIDRLFANVRTRPELIIVTLMVMIIAMLIVPLPTFLVDFLIALNIVIAILLFMGSFYVDKILNFSTFPTILLITTLFRLALSISTSRLILTQADAGEIIATFGRYVIGDTLIVGFVIFSIVTIVQFIVITKGSERVAEVAARFSLDGMPGKQMSIDGDLKAGVIDADGARERRNVLERESQLYGSFDGAMKFIKGDAIAGIVIILVNLIGGIAVGVIRHHMDMSTALQTYTMLTIGDGLVAQIPALLISISAGFIVTRINGDDANLGRNIMGQLLGMPFAVAITALLAVVVAFLPGFPAMAFLCLSLMLGLFLYHGQRRRRRESEQGENIAGAAQSQQADGDGSDRHQLGLIADLDKVVTETVAFILLVPQAQQQLFADELLAQRLRSQFFIDYGVRLPELLVRGSDSQEKDCVTLLINEIRTETLQVRFGKLRIVNMSEQVELLGIEVDVLQDAAQQQCHWVAPSHRDTLARLGFQLRSAHDELYQCLVATLVKHVPEFFGIQETKKMLDQMEGSAPDLIREVLRNATVQKISEVLQRLLSERISIRNFKLILESLAQWGGREKDVIALVEHVRGAMARYISHKFAVGNKLRVVMLSVEMEEQVRKGIRQNSSGAFLNIDPAVSDEIIDKFALLFQGLPVAQKDLIVLTAVDVRRFVKKLLEARFRELDVISFGEVANNVEIDVLKVI